MPRPIEAGVLGIARTIERPGKARSRNASGRPAMIESTSVSLPASGATSASASTAICGFTATTSAAISDVLPFGLSDSPCFARAAISGEGCGSITVILPAGNPSASQDCSMAPPILPAPTRARLPMPSRRLLSDVVMANSPKPRGFRAPSTSPPGNCLCLAGCLENGGVERLARRLARPQHELEGREIAFAGIDRGGQHRAALLARGLDPAGQHQRVPEHHHSIARPQIEMADPHLLVHV